jgi:hypothetical protein
VRPRIGTLALVATHACADLALAAKSASANPIEIQSGSSSPLAKAQYRRSSLSTPADSF